MTLLPWIISAVAAYLLGSVNFALILVRLFRGEDIRLFGSGNPGASNVSRSFGSVLGILVFALDIMKSVVPILLAWKFVHLDNEDLRPILSLTVGFSAVIGHCRSLFLGFKGGRGVAASIGIYLVLIPLEAVAAMIVAVTLVAIFVRNVKNKFGPYVPIIFVVLAPLLSVLTTLLPSWSPTGNVRIGPETWHTAICAWILSLGVLMLNPTFLLKRMADYRAGRDPSRPD